MDAAQTTAAPVEQIAKIRSVTLGWEDHGILTCLVDLDYGGSGQGIGAYALDEPRKDGEGKHIGRFGTAFGMEWICRLMRAAGVDSFDKVQGRTVLALLDGDRYGRVVGLKPLPTEPGEPFIFADLCLEFGVAA
jgi:hypothetical protein